jgi:hypothetical protein
MSWSKTRVILCLLCLKFMTQSCPILYDFFGNATVNLSNIMFLVPGLELLCKFAFSMIYQTFICKCSLQEDPNKNPPKKRNHNNIDHLLPKQHYFLSKNNFFYNILQIKFSCFYFFSFLNFCFSFGT